MEQFAHDILQFFQVVIELLGGFVIVIGVIWAIVMYIYAVFIQKEKSAHHLVIEDLRLKMGRYLGLGLDLLIAADIIKTIISRNIESLIFLGGTVVVRVLLTIFLSREQEQLGRQESRVTTRAK